MDELTFHCMKEFLDDRTKAQAETIATWMNEYANAWDWMQRARWVFSCQYGYPYALVDAVLGQSRRLSMDRELVTRWESVLCRYGDIDNYVQFQAQQTPGQIDAAIDMYWSSR